MVWPRLTLRPPIVASRTASVTTSVWMARAASVIGPALAAASRPGSSASSAAKPSAALRVGTTVTGRSVIEATWRAASTTFGLFGQDDDLARVDVADRLEQLAGARVGGLAALDDRRDPEVAEDRGQAVAGNDRHDAQGRRDGRGGPRCGAGSSGGPGRCRGRRLARERRGPRLADVARLVVEVLDADPAQRADAQPVRR